MEEHERRLNIPFVDEGDNVIAEAYLARDGETHFDWREGSLPILLINDNGRLAARIKPSGPSPQ